MLRDYGQLEVAAEPAVSRLGRGRELAADLRFFDKARDLGRVFRQTLADNFHNNRTIFDFFEGPFAEIKVGFKRRNLHSKPARALMARHFRKSLR